MTLFSMITFKYPQFYYQVPLCVPNLHGLLKFFQQIPNTLCNLPRPHNIWCCFHVWIPHFPKNTIFLTNILQHLIFRHLLFPSPLFIFLLLAPGILDPYLLAYNLWLKIQIIEWVRNFSIPIHRYILHQ